MKYYWILSLLILVGCTDEEKQNGSSDFDQKVENKDPFEGLSKVEAIEFHIRRELAISADEPIDYQIYEEDCDGDDSLDAVITINLLDRAIDDAIKSENVAKSASIGYMGNYNYIVYRDGFTGELSPARLIPSSPKARLKVSFEHVRSERQKDILVDHRILNACYRNYFTITNGSPLRINQVKLFDGMGTKDAVGFVPVYEKGMISPSKDIVMYKGTFENPTFAQLDDVYTFEPEISKTSVIREHWFFNPQDMKYYLKR